MYIISTFSLEELQPIKEIKFYLYQSDVWRAFGQVCVVLSVHIFWNHEKVLMGQLRLGREKDNCPIQHLFHWDIVLCSYRKTMTN